MVTIAKVDTSCPIWFDLKEHDKRVMKELEKLVEDMEIIGNELQRVKKAIHYRAAGTCSTCRRAKLSQDGCRLECHLLDNGDYFRVLPSGNCDEYKYNEKNIL